jgi:hypothetical protein
MQRDIFLPHIILPIAHQKMMTKSQSHGQPRRELLLCGMAHSVQNSSHDCFVRSLGRISESHYDPGMNDELERTLGPQPIADLMQQLQLRPHDLVAASNEQLTFKLVARALKGRRLTINSKGIVQRAINQATGKTWLQSQLFNY